MSTLTHTRDEAPVLPVAQSPGLRTATVLALAVQVPDGGMDHRIDLAAAVLRRVGKRWAPVGRLHCVLHAGMPAAAIAGRCALPIEQVADRTPAAVALTVLERHLTAPPYLLVTYQAVTISTLISRHAALCPTLDAADRVDLAALTRRVLGDDGATNLPSLAARLGVQAAPRPTPTETDAELAGVVYTRLYRITAEAGGHATATAAGIDHPVPHRRTDRQAGPLDPREGKVRRGQAA